jgi:UDP-2,3-diacylglucosamine pyrophosphatase LpxH
MLIFVSDIHFVDGPEWKHNMHARAFEGVLSDLKKNCWSDPKEIKLVFLGDIFDLLRTTYWLDVEEAERPWGDMDSNRDIIEKHANHIFDQIIEQNRTTFDLLKGSLKDRFGFPVEPERIYIPGNHDRLCNYFDSLRIKVRENLGIIEEVPGSNALFPHVYDDRNYGNNYRVFARHGHEYDEWNYEGADTYSEADYQTIPIGDLITTEMVTRLPYTIMQHVSSAMPAEERAALQRNLEEIDNVRPNSAMIQWIYYKVKEKPDLEEAINHSVREVVANFENLVYLKRWYKRHDKWGLVTIDQADKVQGLIQMFKLFNIQSAEELLKIYGKIFGSTDAIPTDNGDRALIDGAKQFLTHTSGYSYVVMGHTHSPLEVPVRFTSAGQEQHYLNTGTWRKKYSQGLAGDFMGLKYLTYVIFYSEDENGDQSFETWNGTLKEG